MKQSQAILNFKEEYAGNQTLNSEISWKIEESKLPEIVDKAN